VLFTEFSLCKAKNVYCIFICAFLGRALVEVGESYKQLAEIKYSVEDNVKQNFLEPLQNLQNKDLKEVNVCILLTVCLCYYGAILKSNFEYFK